MNRKLLAEFAIIALLVILPLLFFWRIVTPNPADRLAFPDGDFTQQYFPLRVFAARELANGRLPLWNPYLYGGQPALADSQSAVLYPVNLLPALVGGSRFSIGFFEAQVIFHFVLAGLFTYFFVRRLTSNHWAGLVAAVGFTFSGYLTSFPVQQPTILSVAVWLPLILLLLDWGFDTVGWTRAARLAIAGLALATSLLGGHPQTSLYVVYTAIAYFLWRAPQITNLKAQMSNLILFIAVGVGAAVVQLLPTLEFIGLSARAQASYEFNASGFGIGELVALVIPGFFGGSPQYLGVLTMIIAALALVAYRHRDRLFWAGLGIIALLISFGGNTFAYSLFYLLVPGFGQVRNQERAIFLFAFAAAVLAGYGTMRLLRPLPRPIKLDVLNFSRALNRLFWGLVALVPLFYFGYVYGQSAKVEINLFDGILRHLIPFVLLFGAGVVLLTLRLGGRIKRAALAACIVALILLNLFTVNWQYNQQKPPDGGFFAATSLVRFLQERRAESAELFRISSEGLLPGGHSAGAVCGLADITGNDPLHLASFEEFSNRVEEWRRWQLLNVRYVVTKRELAREGLREVLRQDDLRVYEITDRLPGAYVVHRAVVADGEAAWDALNRINPRREVVLAASPPIALPPGDVTGSTARVVAYEAEQLVIEVDAVENGLLVLSEIDYPGWQARVDGQDAPILRADVVLRAVPVSKGAHRVEVSFEPRWLQIGALISAATLVGVAALVLAATRISRHALRFPQA